MTFLNTRAPGGHARCANLRCKEMYYHVQLQATDGSPLVTDDQDDRHVYWCLKTTKEYGPDLAHCTLESCSPDRACYQG